MRPGEVAEVVKGEYKGRKVELKGSDGWYYNLHLLDTTGKRESRMVTLHRSFILEPKN